MKRIISDKHVAIIKIMLSQGYSNRAIQDEFLIKHGQKIDLMHLQFIKKGEAYKDVRDDLNEKIFENHSDKRTKNIENIPDIKWALANGFSELEIIKVFEITRSRLHKIKMLFAPFVNISPEYNDAIRLLHRRKKIVNIDKNLVTKIKERYVISNGKQSFSEIGNAFTINTGTVSTILNLKKYSEYGKSYTKK